ncbi:hypothetical protein D9758_002801 [Tetrapyrgos nigripes]|uniref:Chromatin modification-related protein EAF6 n=1 Tax=Tetrapyrgos nigripes TaxID=182062 RepID=A0A8H5LTF5_9AGAR|nr:hypothetical protein D9758_002801 [Tetrapyrgos nigripes]
MADVIDEKARYEALKRELMAALPKKRAMDRKLANLEMQIYNLEHTYLTETTAHSGGNLIQGFENYLKNQTTGRRRAETADHDRIFSNSSLTYQKSLDIMAEEEHEDFPKQAAAGAQQTIAVPPAARPVDTASANHNKLLRDREYSRRRREENRKRASTIDDDDEAIPVSSRRATKRLRTTDDE